MSELRWRAIKWLYWDEWTEAEIAHELGWKGV
ncbi:terminase gpP N-terminus-related DNA-binding protein [Fervidibacter sacchari]